MTNSSKTQFAPSAFPTALSGKRGCRISELRFDGYDVGADGIAIKRWQHEQGPQPRPMPPRLLRNEPIEVAST